MKRAELLKHLDCDLCGRKVTASGLPLFWRLKVERFGIDAQAVRRADGLSAMLGGAALAAVMGTDQDLAKPVMDPVTLTVCETCIVDKMAYVAILSEDKTRVKDDATNS